METFSVILEQLIQFCLLLMMGIVLAKTGVVHEKFLGEFSKIITKCLLPVLIFYSSYHGNSREQLIRDIPVVFIAAGMYLALVVLFWGLAKILKLKGEKEKVFQALFVFGNTGFIGIPLIQALYQNEGMIYMALFSVIDQLILWTYGIYLTDSRNKRMNLVNFVNPAAIAVVLSIICILADIRLPKVLESTLATTGQASNATCMIYLGALFFFSDIKSVLREKELYIGILIKMIVFPICFGSVLGFFHIADDMRKTMILIAGLPTMTVIPMLAKNGGNEGEYAAGITMVTLAASLFTLPLLSLIIF